MWIDETAAVEHWVLIGGAVAMLVLGIAIGRARVYETRGTQLEHILPAVLGAPLVVIVVGLLVGGIEKLVELVA